MERKTNPGTVECPVTVISIREFGPCGHDSLEIVLPVMGYKMVLGYITLFDLEVPRKLIRKKLENSL